MALTYQLTDEEKVRDAEIRNRRSRLHDSKRWLDSQIAVAQQQLAALISGRESVMFEANELDKEYGKLHRW